MSLALIAEVLPKGAVIDVGGGASPLAGRLLDRGYSVTVLDIAPAVIGRAIARLGERAALIRWILGDVTTVQNLGTFEVWHDRAAFHFLTRQEDRQRYAALASKTVPVGGHAIIATFALDGPTHCSGLDVVRYDGKSLQRELGPGFDLLKSVGETHLTPWGKPQSFQYSFFRRVR